VSAEADVGEATADNIGGFVAEKRSAMPMAAL